MSLDIGQVLGGKYAVERVIGRSVLGAVYQGRDQSSNQRVAIRLIQPEFDNEQVAAFVEADVRTAGQLANEHVARLINIGFLPTGERCVISEYVEGETLTARVKREGRLPETQVANLLLQLLEGLSAAHKAGAIHRDLTPNSVIVAAGAQGDKATLIDFGICRLHVLTGNAVAAQARGLESASLQYLSPEQLSRTREIDQRSNLYSLGAIAYEAMTGRRPFEGSDFSDPAHVALQQEPPPVEELAPESSSPFAQLIRKAMSRSPNVRFQSAEEMIGAITSLSNRPSAAASRSSAPAFTPPTPSSAARPVITAPAVDSAAAVMAPPPMPPDEVLARMAPGEPWSAPKSPATEQVASASTPGPVEIAPPPMPPPPEIQLPPSARVAAVLAAASATPPPPPPPMDPTAADIDQSVVDALFAPPPMPADADLPSADDWESGGAPEPKSAPISELQPPRLESPPSRPSSPGVIPPSSPANQAPAMTPAVAAAPAPVVVPSLNEPAPASARSAAGPAPVVVPSLNEPAPASARGATAVPRSSDPDNPVPSRPSISSAPTQPYATLPDEVDEAREKRTILGLGGYGNYPLPTGSSPVASAPVQEPPQSQRPPQATAPGISPLAEATSAADAASAVAESASVPERQTEPEQVATTATAASAAVSAASSIADVSSLPAEPARPIASPAQEAAAPAPATVSSAQPIEQAKPTPAVTAATSQAQSAASAPVSGGSPSAQPKPAVAPRVSVTAATDALDDLGPYGKSRSRKPLVITILLVGLVGAGAAVALMQGHSEDSPSKPESSHASASTPTPRALEASQEKPAPTPTEAQAEPAARDNSAPAGKSGTSLSQAVNAGLLSQSVAASQGKKSATGASAPSKPTVSEKPVAEKPVAEKPVAEKPTTPKQTVSTKPTAVSKPVTKSTGAVAAPTKPAGPKPGKDPYNYR